MSCALASHCKHILAQSLMLQVPECPCCTGHKPSSIGLGMSLQMFSCPAPDVDHHSHR